MRIHPLAHMVRLYIKCQTATNISAKSAYSWPVICYREKHSIATQMIMRKSSTFSDCPDLLTGRKIKKIRFMLNMDSVSHSTIK